MPGIDEAIDDAALSPPSGDPSGATGDEKAEAGAQGQAAGDDEELFEYQGEQFTGTQLAEILAAHKNNENWKATNTQASQDLARTRKEVEKMKADLAEERARMQSEIRQILAQQTRTHAKPEEGEDDGDELVPKAELRAALQQMEQKVLRTLQERDQRERQAELDRQADHWLTVAIGTIDDFIEGSEAIVTDEEKARAKDLMVAALHRDSGPDGVPDREVRNHVKAKCTDVERFFLTRKHQTREEYAEEKARLAKVTRTSPRGGAPAQKVGQLPTSMREFDSYVDGLSKGRG